MKFFDKILDFADWITGYKKDMEEDSEEEDEELGQVKFGPH